MILFIESREGGDFTMDAVFAGLVDKFGAESIIDYPSKKKHREGIPVNTGDKERDYGAERRSLCYTKDFEKLPTLSASEIRTLAREKLIDMIFVDERIETFEKYLELGMSVFRIPVVVVAGHDRFWGTVDQLQIGYGSSLKAMFLDNWRPKYDEYFNAFPMSYAINFDHLWDPSRRDELLKNKVYNLCFTGYNSHPYREMIFEFLLKKYGERGNALFLERRNGAMDTFTLKSEYFEKMAQSRVCLNLRGAAECGKALRFYEIPYVGSYMLSQKDEARQVNQFLNDHHCDYFSNLDELQRKIDRALDDEERREDIARAGHLHAMKHHTARARVDYMFKMIESLGRKG